MPVHRHVQLPLCWGPGRSRQHINAISIRRTVRRHCNAAISRLGRMLQARSGHVRVESRKHRHAALPEVLGCLEHFCDNCAVVVSYLKLWRIWDLHCLKGLTRPQVHVEPADRPVRIELVHSSCFCRGAAWKSGVRPRLSSTSGLAFLVKRYRAASVRPCTASGIRHAAPKQSHRHAFSWQVLLFCAAPREGSRMDVIERE